MLEHTAASYLRENNNIKKKKAKKIQTLPKQDSEFHEVKFIHMMEDA